MRREFFNHLAAFLRFKDEASEVAADERGPIRHLPPAFSASSETIRRPIRVPRLARKTKEM
jgi:hypothetical protein